MLESIQNFLIQYCHQITSWSVVFAIFGFGHSINIDMDQSNRQSLVWSDAIVYMQQVIIYSISVVIWFLRTTIDYFECVFLRPGKMQWYRW